jgi:hypothetical protein
VSFYCPTGEDTSNSRLKWQEAGFMGPSSGRPLRECDKAYSRAG